MDVAVSVAVITAVPAMTAAVLSYRATTYGKQNAMTLRRVEAQTKRQLDRRIERAVKNVFNENPSEVTEAIVSEALHDLLDGLTEVMEITEKENRDAEDR